MHAVTASARIAVFWTAAWTALAGDALFLGADALQVAGEKVGNAGRALAQHAK